MALVSISSFAGVRFQIAMEGDVIEAQLKEATRLKIVEDRLEEAKEHSKQQLLRTQAITRMEEEGIQREEKERKRKFLDRQEEEDSYNADLRRRKAEIELQRNDTLFKAQMQEKVDSNSDSRYVMRQKLQRELQDNFLDNAHNNRARDLVSERSETAMAMGALNGLNNYLSSLSASSSAGLFDASKHLKNDAGKEDDDVEYFTT
mmetsp:Transcript_19979/g.27459  ORF Transcript_19979/g.27459 Transcript_19979/m.27459 type:complete len:204 (+) Transcript_19979:156-767(+)